MKFAIQRLLSERTILEISSCRESEQSALRRLPRMFARRLFRLVVKKVEHLCLGELEFKLWDGFNKLQVIHSSENLRGGKMSVVEL